MEINCSLLVAHYRSTIAGLFKINSKNKNEQIMKLWRQKNENENEKNYFLQSFGVSKPFKVIFTNFLLKIKKWEIQFLRGEPYFFKINKYSFLGARTSYGATVVALNNKSVDPVLPSLASTFTCQIKVA